MDLRTKCPDKLAPDEFPCFQYDLDFGEHARKLIQFLVAIHEEKIAVRAGVKVMSSMRKDMEIFEGMPVGKNPREETEHGVFIEYQQYGFVDHMVLKATRTTAHKTMGRFSKDLTV